MLLRHRSHFKLLGPPSAEIRTLATLVEQRWPTLGQAKQARAATLRRFFHENHMYREGVLDNRLQAIRSTQTINKSYWAGEYYRQQRDKGSTYQAAVRALAFKWIRILYRCWQTGVAYDESRYLKALERRGSPIRHQTTMLRPPARPESPVASDLAFFVLIK